LTIPARYRKQRRTAARARSAPLGSRLLLVAVAHDPGRSGLATRSSGRAGGQLGRSDWWRGLRLRKFSRCWVLGSCGDLRLLLDDNYIRTITNITAEAQSTRRTNERRRLLLRSSALFLKCGCCRRSGSGCCSLAVACGPGRPELRRDRKRGLAWRAIVQGGRRPVGPEVMKRWSRA
jgi:hypothetical protein